MYLFLPALTLILVVLIACTQTNTTPYVVVSEWNLFLTLSQYAYDSV